MSFTGAGIRIVQETVSGNKIANTVTIYGDDILRGNGFIAIDSHIEIDGEKVKDQDPTKIIQLAGIFNERFSDGEGGTITGLQAFRAFCDMCDRAWEGKLP